MQRKQEKENRVEAGEGVFSETKRVLGFLRFEPWWMGGMV